MINFELRQGRADRLGEFADPALAAAALPQGAYTTLRTFNTDRVLALDRHVDRLRESARRLGRAGKLSQAELASGLAAAVVASAHRESRIRVTFAPPRLFASIEPFAPVPEPLRSRGVACATVPVRRSDVLCKDTRFAVVARELAAALPPGVHEGLLLGEDGELLEGLSSNFFALRSGAMHTEGVRALPGLTRELVLELARQRLPVVEHPIRLAELAQVDECFISSTSRGVLSVVSIDGQPVGSGRPGPVTRALEEALVARVEAEAVSLDELARGKT